MPGRNGKERILHPQICKDTGWAADRGMSWVKKRSVEKPAAMQCQDATKRLTGERNAVGLRHESVPHPSSSGGACSRKDALARPQPCGFRVALCFFARRALQVAIIAQRDIAIAQSKADKCVQLCRAAGSTLFKAPALR